MSHSVLQRLEVAEVIARYTDSINHRDWERYRDCWTEDCVFRQTVESDQGAVSDSVTSTKRPINLEAIGREAVLKLVSAYNNYKWAFQLTSGVFVIMSSGAEARIRHVLQIRTSLFTMLGFCYDRAIECSDGVWRITHRDYRPSYFETSEAPGITCRTLPDASYRQLPRV
jgi:hypothetical protein